VQAVVSKPIPTIFLQVFKPGTNTLTVSATATADEGQSSPTRICLEGTSGEDLNMSNGSSISAPNCGVTVDSSGSNAIGMVGGTSLTAQTLGTVSSTWDNSGNISGGSSIASSTKIVKGITTSCGPAMPTAPTYGTCRADPGGTSTSFTAGPSSSSGTICYQSLTLGSNNTSDTLNPGTYVITGYLTFNSGTGGHSNLGGNGVFFYLTGTASLTIQNSANVNLVAGGLQTSGGATAPTVGNYSGILFYQAASDTQAVTVDGGSNAYMQGNFYAPSAAVTLNNGTTSTTNGDVVAKTLTMAGGGKLLSSPGSNLGTLNIGVAKLSQ